MAEALLNSRGNGRFHAESAGSRPAARAHPLAIETLTTHGIPWMGHPPRGLERVERDPWDVVITVCDRAKAACPVFSGGAVRAHWGIPDPAEAKGDDVTRRAAFHDAFRRLERRVAGLLALPVETLEPRALAARLEEIGREAP
jgi:arsenate reductase (thioredoxin)